MRLILIVIISLFSLINHAAAQKKEVQPQPKTATTPTAEECETATRNYNLELMGLCNAAEQARIEKCRQGVCQTEEINAPVNNSVIRANRFNVK